jgi:hypothetical protein
MARVRERVGAGIAFASVFLAIIVAGCSKTDGASGFETGEAGSSSGDDVGGDATADVTAVSFSSGGNITLVLDGDVPERTPPPATCKLPGLWCYQTAAPCVTSLSGTVYDPAGQVPLDDVVVYVPAVPTTPLPTITPGTNSCSACTTQISNYMALAVTDVNGHFTMTGVPATTNVPVVVQIGKWRRQISLSQVTKCVDNAVPDGILRLPRSKSEGNLPQMAVVTGGADDLGCFLRGIGLDATEYTAPQGGGRLDVYTGQGGPGLTSGGTAGACAGANPVCPLWASKSALEYYDIVLLACEGSTNANAKPAASLQYMHDWLGEGGKVFATHFQYYWFQSGPTDFQNVADWLGFSAGIGFGNYTVDNSFQRGMVFEQWLDNVGAATGATIALNGVADSVSTVTSNATRWIYDPNSNDVKYLSFLTPIGGIAGNADGGGEKTTYCGKAVFSDLHTSGTPSASVPGPCPTTLTAQQKALEFLFFDLAACVAPENMPIPVPTMNPPPPPPPM